MLRLIASVLLFVWTSFPAFSERLMQVELNPIQHNRGALVVVDMQGTKTNYSSADLENMTTYRMVTTTPWRRAPTQFDGVMLVEILRKHGLDQVSEILVSAEDGFGTLLSRDLFQSVDILVATRVNGKAHQRRQRGPLQLIIHEQDFRAPTLAKEANLVWMVARIAPKLP